MKTFQFVNIPYGKQSDEPTPWEIWRHNGIDAEDAATIAGENPWETREELLSRKAAIDPVRKPATPAMVQGKLLRPQALNAYRSLTGIHNLEPASLENIEHPWMIAHPDLMRGYHIAEVHCGESTLRKAHETGRLPKPYWAEAQHILMTTGYRKLAVYLHNPTPAMAPKVFEVFGSPDFQKDLLKEEIRFLAERDAARELEIAMAERLEKAKRLEATIQAITGQGPRVPMETFREFVPKFLTRKGTPTEDGIVLLRPLHSLELAGK